MVLLFFKAREKTTIASLIEEGKSIGAYGPHGWVHEGIVRLAHNHGIHAYAQEFRSNNTYHEEAFEETGVEKIKQKLHDGFPTIVSIQKENGSYHTITVIGVSDEGFICHDPEIGADRVVLWKEFKSQWRKLAIFIHP